MEIVWQQRCLIGSQQPLEQTQWWKRRRPGALSTELSFPDSQRTPETANTTHRQAPLKRSGSLSIIIFNTK